MKMGTVLTFAFVVICFVGCSTSASKAFSRRFSDAHRLYWQVWADSALVQFPDESEGIEMARSIFVSFAELEAIEMAYLLEYDPRLIVYTREEGFGFSGPGESVLSRNAKYRTIRDDAIQRVDDYVNSLSGVRIIDKWDLISQSPAVKNAEENLSASLSSIAEGIEQLKPMRRQQPSGGDVDTTHAPQR